jgi:S-DNA-T family DNA segregation ATPase FtsK/SpoIIIE
VQIVFRDGDARRELDVRVNNPSATVDDLARALDPTGGRRLLIDDRPADGDFDLIEAGLHEGADVRLADGDEGDDGDHDDHVARGPFAPSSLTRGAGEVPAAYELVVVNGLDAGRRVPLRPGTTVVGRAPVCDASLPDTTLSRRHATVTLTAGGEVTVEDLGSHNGTWADGEAVLGPTPVEPGTALRLGALELAVRPVDDDDRPRGFAPARQTGPAGTVPFNRPPRPALPAPPEPVDAPRPPESRDTRSGFSVIAVVTPLIFAGAMYALFRSVHFLLFAGLTPLMGIANAIDAKRKGRRTERGDRERFARELDELRDHLVEQVGAERDRRAGAYPDPAEIVRRVELPTVTLWERRPGDADFLHLRVGIGDVRWEPPVVATGRRSAAPDELVALLDEASTLHGCAVPLDLSSGGVVGIVGDRAAALALARSLVCQAAVLHGPADLPVMVLAGTAVAADWDWAKWLPHTRDATGAGRLLSDHPDLSVDLVEAVLREHPGDDARRVPGGRPVGPTLLAVVDDEALIAGRRAPTRNLLRGDGGPVAGIVVAATADRLPAVCTAVVEVTDASGVVDLVLPQAGRDVRGVAPAGMADDVSRSCARSLARFEDPELDVVGAGLPSGTRLLPLLELEDCTAEAVLARWKAAGPDPRPATPIGVSEDGVLTLDLVADGPHGLVGGTTGAGKSELLRSLVAGLAASVDPDHLTFVLVDFKGGSAFDECAALPHTVGMVTDLDEHLAERALRCLEAELRHRERVLRAAGATDLPDYLRKRLPDPLPRLLVVIDEFATLKAELPQFIDALVGVAQRGRSLGVHMLLATQRPQGAVSDNIRANTNMRIALRMQDTTDSKDVIDVADAAAIPRTSPGRAYVRLGPGEVVAIQSALSTGDRTCTRTAPVDVAPFTFGPRPRRPAPSPPTGSGPARGDAGPETDLAVLVGAISEAFARTGRPAPRRPWPDPLPASVDLDDLVDAGHARADGGSARTAWLALADDPDAQSRYPVGWVPADGNLLVYGIGGSGTTTTLASTVLSLARDHGPDDLHSYVLDMGAGDLESLAALPHVGGVVGAGERERQTRLVRFLRDELDRRRAMGAAAARREPMVVTVLDGWSAFAAEYADFTGTAVWEAWTRVLADGPEVGLCAVISADRTMAVANAVASLIRQKLVLRLADRNDYTGFGVRGAAVPDMVPGRALLAGSGQVVQIARPSDGLAAAATRLAARHPAPTRPPAPVEPLPTDLRFADLGVAADLGDRPWRVPIAMSEATRAPVGLVAYRGEHGLIAGPARSGRSTALLAVAAACRAGAGDVTVVAVAGPRSPLSTDASIDHVVAPGKIGDRLAPAVDGVSGGRLLVLIDDAEIVDDVGGQLERLSTSDRPDLLVVAAGRNDGIRTGYSHWTRPLRRSKLGVLLRPEADVDGDILGVVLPRRPLVPMTSGRGYVAVAAEATLAQVAQPR